MASLKEDNISPCPSSPGAHAKRNKRKKELVKLRKEEAKAKAMENKDDKDLEKMSEAELLDALGKEMVKMKIAGEIKKENNAAEPLYKVKPAPGKRLGMFAVKDIAKGTEILREEAIFKGSKNWFSKHAMFTLLPDDKKREFMPLHSQCNCGKAECLETDFQKVWDANSFEITLIPALPLPTEYAGPFVYLVASRINHDCAPNTSRGFTNKCQVVFRANKDIKAGEEITTDYSGLGIDPVASRRQHLTEKYKFLCGCKACSNNKQLSAGDVLKGVEVKVVTRPGLPVLGQHTAKEEKDFAGVDVWYRQNELKAKNDGSGITFVKVYKEKVARLFDAVLGNDKYGIGWKDIVRILSGVQAPLALQTRNEFEAMAATLPILEQRRARNLWWA
ncbi:uncharacterized protein PAC_03340 [Phialocephala subalpina]|uniref:SET domain-containing protein n=1 Tax=Phialocephala subalpina TaxID=576137 RepID=A0A1L7WL11_9HELO|nr:uncharacterized protein PAC_03340 [Phialocephala subalpina]